jgi:hypothetical protein
MESIILAVCVALTVWLFMRRQRMKRKQKIIEQQEAQNAGPPQEQKSMPRIGQAGSITRDQMKALKDNDFEPSRIWSKEEAQLILDSVDYLRAVIAQQTGEKKPPMDVQNQVLGFILSDEELREYLLDRARNQTREEAERGKLTPTQDEHYARVAEFVTGLWESN